MLIPSCGLRGRGAASGCSLLSATKSAVSCLADAHEMIIQLLLKVQHSFSCLVKVQMHSNANVVNQQDTILSAQLPRAGSAAGKLVPLRAHPLLRWLHCFHHLLPHSSSRLLMHYTASRMLQAWANAPPIDSRRKAAHHECAENPGCFPGMPESQGVHSWLAYR
jgi:hypothetical protein